MCSTYEAHAEALIFSLCGTSMAHYSRGHSSAHPLIGRCRSKLVERSITSCFFANVPTISTAAFSPCIPFSVGLVAAGRQPGLKQKKTADNCGYRSYRASLISKHRRSPGLIYSSKPSPSANHTVQRRFKKKTTLFSRFTGSLFSNRETSRFAVVLTLTRRLPLQ
jgi:hypothetical protein